MLVASPLGYLRFKDLGLKWQMGSMRRKPKVDAAPPVAPGHDEQGP